MGGHSRGHLTACRFKADFGKSYENLLVLGFDGSWCGQTGRKPVTGVCFFSAGDPGYPGENVFLGDKNLITFW